MNNTKLLLELIVLVEWEPYNLQVNLYIYNIVLENYKYHEEDQTGLKIEGHFILWIQVGLFYEVTF